MAYPGHVNLPYRPEGLVFSPFKIFLTMRDIAF
jgi:hypothetical protein